MYQQAIVLLDKDLGMGSLMLGRKISLSVSNMEYSLTNVLILLTATVKFLEPGATLFTRNKIISDWFTHGGVYETKNRKLKRASEELLALVELKKIQAFFIQGRLSITEKKLLHALSLGRFIVQEFDDPIDLDSFIGYEYTSNREKKRYRQIQKGKAAGTFSLQRQSYEKTMGFAIPRPESRGVTSSGYSSEKGSPDETRTLKIDQGFVHILAGDQVYYMISDSEISPYDHSKNYGRKIPDANIKRILKIAKLGKVEREVIRPLPYYGPEFKPLHKK